MLASTYNQAYITHIETPTTTTTATATAASAAAACNALPLSARDERASERVCKPLNGVSRSNLFSTLDSSGIWRRERARSQDALVLARADL